MLVGKIQKCKDERMAISSSFKLFLHLQIILGESREGKLETEEVWRGRTS